jgi:DNA-3-methyladenine glycosylase I
MKAIIPERQIPQRCDWSVNDLLYIDYHDKEWGTPLHDDKKLFEFLILEGFQEGLSWFTILKKREHFKKAFDDFNPNKIVLYDNKKITGLMNNSFIIRNQLKINSAVLNAKAFLTVQNEFGSFDKYIWQFSDGRTIRNSWKNIKTIPPTSKVSDLMSKDLKKRGFKFVGSTICYAFMQAVGIVNDHVITCFRYKELSAKGGSAFG